MDIDEDALQGAMAPGTAKVRALLEAVGNEMAGRSAEDVHAELVSRLQAEPFVWDDSKLRRIAEAISRESAEADSREPTDRDSVDDPSDSHDTQDDGASKTEKDESSA